MHSRDTVTDSDLRRLLHLVDRAREAPGTHDLPSALLPGLQALVPSTDIGFFLLDVPRRDDAGGLYLGAGEVLHDLVPSSSDSGNGHDVFWDAWAREEGCGYTQVRRDWTTVLRRSDRIGDRAFARTRLGQAMQEEGVRHEVMVALPPLGQLERRLVLFRHDGPDFSEREVLLLKLFRPHLIELHEEHRRRSRPRPALTARQWEVLQVVASGASNQQVARALSLSPATVRKHLENVFASLGVSSRTEAVARAAPFLATVEPVHAAYDEGRMAAAARSGHPPVSPRLPGGAA